MPVQNRYPEYAGGKGTYLAVGEVDHLVGAVDENQANRQQAVGETDDDTEKQERGRDLQPQDAGHPAAAAPRRNTARTRSSRCSNSRAGPSNRISPFSMK